MMEWRKESNNPYVPYRSSAGLLVNSTKLNSSRPNSSQVDPSRLNLTHLNSDQLRLTKLSSTEQQPNWTRRHSDQLNSTEH